MVPLTACQTAARDSHCGVDLYACINTALCPTEPTTCAELEANFAPGGCAAACTQNERSLIVIDLNNDVDNPALSGCSLMVGINPSPPPPPPPSPSPFSPLASNEILMEVPVVVVSMIAAGDVSDFDAADRAAIAATFAAEASVPVSAVTVSITSMSVSIDVSIQMPDSTAAAVAVSSLSATLANATAATTFLAAVVPDIQVQSTSNVVSTVQTVVAIAPPPSPSPPSSGATGGVAGSQAQSSDDDDDLDGGAIAGIVIGSLAFVLLVGVAIMYMKGEIQIFSFTKGTKSTEVVSTSVASAVTLSSTTTSAEDKKDSV